MNLKFKDEGTDNFTSIDANTQLLMLRLSPFSGAFYLTAGPAFLDWTENGAKTGEVADSGVTARISWKTTFPSTGLLYALGQNWNADFGLSGNIGFTVEIEITETHEGQVVIDADIEKHRQTLINESSNIT